MFDYIYHGISDWLENNPEIGMVVVSIILIMVCTSVWVFMSANEAAAFERLTGKKVSTWDAMFIELRIQEPSNK